MKFLSYFFGSLFGVGYIPFAPGTMASAFSLILYYLIDRYTELPDFQYNLGILIVFVAGVAIGNHIERDSKIRDPKFVVIDEFLGIIVTFWGLDFIHTPYMWHYLIAGFVLFRIFDILKPYPVRVLDTVRGGFGIMADDFVAGIIANFILKVATFIYQIYYL
jgi:phosphatidylglycerophosphatase A